MSVHLSMHPVLLAALGVCVGLLGSTVGAGGGFFVVPYLVLAAGFEPADANATSLVVVFVTGLAATVGYERERSVDHRLGLSFALASVPGAVAGTYLVPLVPRALFAILFAAILLVAATLMVLPLREKTEAWPVRRVLAVGVPASAAIGVLASLLGIGGGLLLVPVLVLLFGMTMRRSAATASFLLVLTSAAGAIAFGVHGRIHPEAALWLGAGALAGALAGVPWSRTLKEGRLRRVLAAVLVLVACGMLLRNV